MNATTLSANCSNDPPTIVFAPGAWIGPDVFDDVRTRLDLQGYSSRSVGHPSIGAEPPTKTLSDDVANFRAALNGLVSEGKDVVVVAHSYGGIVASNAVQDLGAAQRAQSGALGGIVMLMYLTAFVVPLGMTLLDMMGGTFLPWMKFDGNYCTAGPEAVEFYYDVPQAKKDYWIPRQTHISKPVFTGAATYEPWHDMPTMYFHCDGDLALPPSLQQQMAEMLGPDATMFHANSSHFPFHSVPQKVVDGVKLAAKVGMRKKAEVIAGIPASQRPTGCG